MEFTNQSETFVFSGTARDFVANKLTLNGKVLDPVTVNSLAKHGLLVTEGWGAKPARGRTPRVFKAISREGMSFGVFVPPVVEPIETNSSSEESIVVQQQADEYQADAIAEAQSEVTVESNEFSF